ncbi:hypothetical protein IGJ94_001873 [Enterococcus sp. AZ153]|uniref:hypothetical protein n=1 Tax=unclassified Enterococcus TaxID=2608891 RepID=UPI003F224EFC
MNSEETYQTLKLLAQTKRKDFLNSNDYASIMTDIMLQILNLKDNSWKYQDLAPYKFNVELISLYNDYLTLHESDFKHRDILNLKKSLENSIYSTLEPRLLQDEMQNLITNEEDSFLVIPLSIFQYDSSKNEWISHEVGSIIRKKSDLIEVEIIDKSGLFIPSRAKQTDYVWSQNHKNTPPKIIIDYHYYISIERISELSDLLSLGINNLETQKKSVFLLPFTHEFPNFSNSNIRDYFFTKLSTISNKEHYGNKISSYQALGNCFSKELDTTLKVALGKIQPSNYLEPLSMDRLNSYTSLSEYKLPNIKSTSTIYASLIAILMDRFESLKFMKEDYQTNLIELYNTYKYLKNCRQDSPFKKTLQTKLTNQLYSNSNLVISKTKRTNLSIDSSNMNLDYIKNIRKALIHGYFNPKSLDNLNAEIKKQPFYKRKKWKESITVNYKNR